MKLIITIIFTIFSISSFSQGNYKLEGNVIDANTKEPLIGATVRIAETTMGTVTKSSGQFEIDNIKNQKIKIIITYVGYARQEIDFDFEGKKSKYIKIELIQASSMSGDVIVYGRTTGQVAAMLDQKRADNIKNIVSEEQIKLFPDQTAGQAMQRIPGVTMQDDQGEARYVQLRGTPPELTNFNINGQQIPSPEGGVRFVGMDIISADQIEKIEITKVLTPDMNGDGIGGNVNIVTKSAQSDEPVFNVALTGAYNNIRNSPGTQIQMNFGQRMGKLGVNVNGNYYYNQQGSDNLEFKFTKGPYFAQWAQDLGEDNYFLQYREVQLRHYNIERERVGLSATLDYKFDDKNQIFLRGIINEFTDQETRRRKIYDLDDAADRNFYLYGGIEQDLKDRTKIQTVNSLALDGEHDLDFMKITYMGSYSYAEEDQPDRLEVRFDNPGQAIQIKFTRNDTMGISASEDFPIALIDEGSQENAVDWENYRLEEIMFEETMITDRNYIGALNFEIPYSFGSNMDGYFKFGGQYIQKRKDRDISSDDFNNYRVDPREYAVNGEPLNLAEVSDDFEDNNLLERGYEVNNIPNADKVREFYRANNHSFIRDITGTRTRSFGEDYNASEDVYAAYLMFKQNIEKLSFVTGVRYELTEANYQGFVLKRDRYGNVNSMDSVSQLSVDRRFEFILPNLQMKYALTPNFNIRAALSYSYSRPNFEDIVPYRDQDREEIVHGNPNLDFPSATNVDFLVEQYIQGNGIISGGFFFKRIDDFIYNYKRIGREGSDPSAYGQVEIEKAVNGDRALVYGAEFQTQFQFKFDFVPKFFQNFGIFMNYTYTGSEAYINKRESANNTNAIIVFGEEDEGLQTEGREQISLPGQATHNGNAAIFYDNRRLYLKLTANFNDAFLTELGADPDMDEYYDAQLQFDFNAIYTINPRVEAFFNVVNLTNTPLKYYSGVENEVKLQEFYSWNTRFGIKINM